MTDSRSHSTPAVLVTGANRNIGAHMAHRFIDDGWPVVAHYRSHTPEIASLAERGARLVQGEFADAEQIQTIARAIGDVAPVLRAIVHNASAFSPTPDDTDAAAAAFQAFFEVHMLAPYLLNNALASHLRAAEGLADIIHITDIYADNPSPAYDIYCATKAGAQNLALSFAKRLSPQIKVNAIQPGPISFEDWLDEDARARMLKATPLGKTGTPEAIYGAVRAIMTNDYQTGAIIAVDGGRRLGAG